MCSLEDWGLLDCLAMMELALSGRVSYGVRVARCTIAALKGPASHVSTRLFVFQ